MEAQLQTPKALGSKCEVRSLAGSGCACLFPHSLSRPVCPTRLGAKSRGERFHSSWRASANSLSLTALPWLYPMALSLTSTTRGGDAATNDTAALITNTLAGKVLHTQADLQVLSCEDISKRDAPVPQKKPALVESVPGSKAVDYATSTESQANWWAEAIAKNMDLPDGYSKVAVLLIKWADELDQLRTGQEVREQGRRVGMT